MRITIQNIKDWAKPHPHKNGGKATRIVSRGLTISIVGGAMGLYGDFVEDFEMAIWENKNDSWRTKFFYPEATDDVVGYMSPEELEKVVNLVVGNSDFQVI